MDKFLQVKTIVSNGYPNQLDSIVGCADDAANSWLETETMEGASRVDIKSITPSHSTLTNQDGNDMLIYTLTIVYEEVAR